MLFGRFYEDVEQLLVQQLLPWTVFRGQETPLSLIKALEALILLNHQR